MFQLPREVIEGIEDYKNSLDELLRGRTNPSRFAGVRVPWGIYSQRGGRVFMGRIRIPAGQVTPDQLKAIASVAHRYGDGIVHITTRQDIQVHGVKIEDTLKVMEYLKGYNLSPRGGGGNTVRNITACVLAGVCKEEVFDVRGHALSLTEYLLRQNASFALPRKFKIGFSGCPCDCAGCLVNDVGLLAAEKEGNKGFIVFAGGGMGAESILGGLLEEFIPQEDLGYCIEAVKNVFYKNGDRKNKHHNRLRFFIRDKGWKKFKDLYGQELRSLKETEYISLRKIDLSSPESPEEQIPCKTEREISQETEREFIEFVKFSLFPQKQKGLVIVELRIPKGDIQAKQLEVLAGLDEEFPGIEFRTSQNQNILVCNVRTGDVYRFFLSAREILPDFLYPSTLLDVVCCKGAMTCNLGLCNSPGLTAEVEKVIKGVFMRTRALRTLAIKINGCPNACGHHPLGPIALHGVVRRVYGRPAPFYKLLLGGRKAFQDTRLAKDTGILLPAKNVPLFLKSFIERIERDMDESADMDRYLAERGEGLAKEVATAYSHVTPYEENKEFYYDWGKTVEFSLEGLGPGECGAGVLDMIEADLEDARISLEKAKELEYSPEAIKKGLFYTARALLVTRGSDPKNEEGVFSDFIEKFVRKDTAPHKFSSVEAVYRDLHEALPAGEREEAYQYAKDFFESINHLYKSMDSSFKFPQQETQKIFSEEGKKANYIFDLKGTPCPINYVKAKLFLEDLEPGEVVEILLDSGDPIENVPKSLRNDGHQIMAIEELNGSFKLVVEKGDSSKGDK